MSRFCNQCGNSIDEDAKFCTSCGSAVGGQTSPDQVQPVQSTYHPTTAPMSIGQWLITMLVIGIPLIGLIMTFVWAFGSSTNINRKNYCAATLIMIAIGIAVGVFFTVVWGGFFSAFFSEAFLY